MNPKISVLTTVLNCEKYISESIESILNQSLRDFEYIIVNDGSTDKTPEIIDRYAAKDSRVIVINNSVNLGRVPSLNKALEISKGKYIALQDADDISLPKRLQEQYSFLEKNEDYVLAGTNIVVMDEYENYISKPMRPEDNLEAKFNLLFRCTFANPSIMFRKKVIDENNIRYEENFIHAEDFRIITLISQHGKVYNLQEPLVKYRKHSNNNSVVNFDILSTGSVEIVKENMAKMGFNISEEQVVRIRNLMSSRGINREFLYDDVMLIFKAIKSFKLKNNSGKNVEILFTLKRMMKWLGRKNIIMNPKYMSLYISLRAYYYKETFLNSN